MITIKINWVIFFIVIIALSIAFYLLGHNSNNEITGSFISDTKIDNYENDSPILNQEEIFEENKTEVEGYRYCNFVFDYENEQWAKEQEWIFKDFCNLSDHYPHIKEFLYDEYKVELVDSDNIENPAWYYGGGVIIINKRFRNAKIFDIYFAHEIAHSAAEDLNLPIWLDEGIAQYSAYRFFGTQGKLKRSWYKNIETNWDGSLQAYAYAGNIVMNFIETYGEDKFKEFLIDINGKIDLDDPIEVKNKKVLESLRKVTGNENLTLQEILFFDK